MSRKKSRRRLNYYNFVDSIDVDALEAELEFDVLSQNGDEDIGKCPDLWGLHKHGDSTGKFALNREKKVYHCWVCGGGDLLSLAMEYLGEGEEEAVEWLAQFASEELHTDSEVVSELYGILEEHRERGAEKMPYFNNHVLEQFEGHNESDLADWIIERGIGGDVARKHQLGYHPNHKRPAPFKGGEKIDDDYYGPCIVFPHYWQGRLVGWQHRWLNYPDTPKWLGKYTNTGDFPKNTTLYNYDVVKQSTHVVVVESIPTVLFLETLGYPTISPFGGSIKPEQLRLLRHFDSVALAPDNDKVGDKFVKKCVEYLDEFVQLLVVPPPEGEGADLGDLINVRDPEAAVIKRFNASYRPKPRLANG